MEFEFDFRVFHTLSWNNGVPYVPHGIEVILHYTKLHADNIDQIDAALFENCAGRYAFRTVASFSKTEDGKRNGLLEYFNMIRFELEADSVYAKLRFG